MIVWLACYLTGVVFLVAGVVDLRATPRRTKQGTVYLIGAVCFVILGSLVQRGVI